MKTVQKLKPQKDFTMSGSEKNLQGKISSVTPHTNCGIVTLDQPWEGFSFAVIDPQSQGRDGLVGNKLVEGKGVEITKWEEGIEALKVKQFQLS